MEAVLLVLVSLMFTGEIKQSVERMAAPEDCYNAMILRKLEPLPEGVVDGKAFCIRAPLNPLRNSRPL